ncbi:MAG: FtsL-like putative cell division protein [Crocinitomicaceae bacterium]
MSGNEFVNIDELKKKWAEEEKKQAKKKKPRAKKAAKSSSKTGGRTIVQIMNGEFLSKDWFINNLPFTFFIGFLLVVIIGWGYYTETVIKDEVNLKTELSELESEFFTLNSEYITKKGRENVTAKLPVSGPKENRTTPNKIKVDNYVFD